MSQNILIETLNCIKQVSIQMVQQQVDKEKQEQVSEQILEQEKFFIEEFKNSQKDTQKVNEQIQIEDYQKSNDNSIQLYTFNQTKQYLKNILKRVKIIQTTHILQNKVISQKNEKKEFLNNLIEQSIIFSWYNILLQQENVKKLFQMCIQQKNPQFNDQIEDIFKINFSKIIQENNQEKLKQVNNSLVQVGKMIIEYQSDKIEERMIHFEQICLKVVKNEEIDQIQLNSIPLHYFLRYCIQLIITSFDVFCRLYLIYNDDKGQMKIKNLWINKKLAFENDFPIFIHIKNNKTYFYLCLKIKLTDDELEQKLANLKRNSYQNKKQGQSPIQKKIPNSDNTNKNKNVYRDKFFQSKQIKRKSNYQIKFEQTKGTKKVKIKKFQNNIYDDLEEININKDNSNKKKINFQLYKIQEQDQDFPTSKLNTLKNSIKKQNQTQEIDNSRSKTVQNKKFKKSIIDLKIDDSYQDKNYQKNKSIKKKFEKQKSENIKNGIFSYRRTNESFQNLNLNRGISKEKIIQKKDDYILKPNISKLIKKSNKFKSIRDDKQNNEIIKEQNSNTSLEKQQTSESFFETFQNFEQKIDQQIYQFNKNDQVLSFCVRKQQKRPSKNRTHFLKKYNLKSNQRLLYRQTSDQPINQTKNYLKGIQPLLNFRKQNSQNNYPSYEKINVMTPTGKQTQNNTNL